MKKLLIGFMLAVTGGSVALAQTNFYTNVTNLWYQGYKTNVLVIANARLATNTNDIAGLILKYECHIAFLEMSSISNAAQRVLGIGETVASTNFALVFPLYSESISSILSALPNYPPAELAADRQKISIIHKPLAPGAKMLIKALQDDGYFE